MFEFSENFTIQYTHERHSSRLDNPYYDRYTKSVYDLIWEFEEGMNDDEDFVSYDVEILIHND